MGSITTTADATQHGTAWGFGGPYIGTRPEPWDNDPAPVTPAPVDPVHPLGPFSGPTGQVVDGLNVMRNPVYSVADRMHGVHWGTADAPMFGPSGKVDVEDMHQGHCGDCYLDAAMAAFALQRPDYIQRMVQPVSDQYVKITLPNQKPFAVTTELPLRADGVPEYDSHDKGVPLWPAMLEKGFAATTPLGYDKLGMGGQVYTGMAMLTGTKPKSIPAPDDLVQDIAARLAAKQPLVMATQMSQNSTMKALNVYDGHVYTVVGTASQVNGQPGILVQERNPWGVSQPTTALNEQQLRECFSGLSSDTQYYDL